MAAISSLTLIVLAIIYRPLVAECYDPGFLRVAGGRGPIYHIAFLVLVVINLVAGFQALGTLMAVGLMMLPAAAARLWSSQVASLAATASAIAFGSGAFGPGHRVDGGTRRFVFHPVRQQRRNSAALFPPAAFP